jgi:hypothetical protein
MTLKPGTFEGWQSRVHLAGGPTDDDDVSRQLNGMPLDSRAAVMAWIVEDSVAIEYQTSLTPRVRMRRAEAARQAAASLRLEGLAPEPEDAADTQLWVDGLLSSDAVMSRIRARHTR